MFKKGLLFIALLASLYFSIGSFSFALADTGCGSDTSNYNYKDASSICPPTFTQVGDVVTAILEAFFAIAAVVFFFMIVINGFNFITAMGDSEKIDNARKGLLFTVIGFGLLFGSFVALSIIANVTGLKGGFQVDLSTGTIHFNLQTTYTPTPLPSGSTNTNPSISI